MKVPTTHRIWITLENAIVGGRYQPGDRIDPEQLAADYQCSRTPVREALLALEASGLLVVQPKHGTFVTRLNITQLMERFELMAKLEAFCAQLACRRASDQHIKQILAGVEACEVAADRGDTEAYYHENTLFHRSIHRASGNGFLEAEAQRLQLVLQPYRRRQLAARGRMKRSLQEHRDVAAAICAADEAAAQHLIIEYVLVQGERFRDLAQIVAQTMTSEN